MRFDTFAEPFRQNLQESIGPALARLSAGQPAAEQGPFTLHESCLVKFVDLPADGPVGSLADFERSVPVWHHQIHSNGQPLYYARTRSDEYTSHFVEVVRSDWAKRFAALLPMVESIPDPPGEELIVRLLIVPRVNDWAFGLYRGSPAGDSELVRVIPLAAVPFEEGLGVKGASDGEGEYLDRLRGLPSAIGISS